MLRVSTGALLLLVFGCEDAPPEVAEDAGAVVVPVVHAVDSGAQRVILPSTPRVEAPVEERVIGLPDEPKDSLGLEGEGLTRALLRDPVMASRALGELATPSVWQQAVRAQLAKHLGDPDVLLIPEAKWPEVPVDGGDLEADAGAWVARQSLPVRASSRPKAPLLFTLPFGTPVQVLDVDGGLARVTVLLATDVSFASTGEAPTAVSGVTRAGVVEAKWLSSKAPSAATLWALADASQGNEDADDLAVVLAEQAFTLDRSEEGREHLLRTAVRAQRASVAVEAALAPVMVTPRRLDVAWGCRGDVKKARWVSFASGRLPTKLPADVCLGFVDLRKPCESRVPALAAWARRTEGLVDAGVAAHPLVSFTVDATAPRRLWLYSITVDLREGCRSPPEYELNIDSTELRHLNLPLGISHTTVRVDLDTYDGKELGVLAAWSERKARDWLRKRARYRWTLDPTGELNVTLGLTARDQSFSTERNVASATCAQPPAFDCVSCGD